MFMPCFTKPVILENIAPHSTLFLPNKYDYFFSYRIEVMLMLCDMFYDNFNLTFLCHDAATVICLSVFIAYLFLYDTTSFTN